MQKDIFFYTTLVLAAALAVIAGLLYGPDVKDFTKAQAQRVGAIKAEAKPPPRIVDPEVNSAELEREFEDILNGFLKDLKVTFVEYKMQRKVVDELIDPFNLRSPEYVQQNAVIIRDLMPGFRAQMESIIATFSKTDQNIMNALDGHSERMKSPILAKWTKTKKEQSNKVIQYLNLDDQILSTYESLLSFYADHTDEFIYNADTERIDFFSPDLKAAEQSYLKRIEELGARRNAALKQNI